MINIEQLKAEFGPYGSKEYPEVYDALRLLEEAQQVIAQRNGECDRLINEIAALKGEQVPVGIWCIQEVTDDEGGISRTEFLSVTEGVKIPKDAQLFTVPQKPVVLPDGMKPCLQRGGQQSTSYRAIMTFSGDWLHRDMVIEAIEAAGGIVKGGD